MLQPLVKDFGHSNLDPYSHVMYAVKQQAAYLNGIL